MNFKEAKDKLRVIHGMTLTKKEGEYRVNFPGGKEATAYYTDDLSDAFATGVDMALRLRGQHVKTTHARINPRRKTKRAKPRRRVTAPRKTYRSAKKHTRKASTRRLQDQWEHVYETARKKKFSEGDAIKIANGVIRQSSERVRKNPLKRAARKSTAFGRRTDPHIVEAVRVGPGKRVSFFYLTPGETLNSTRSRAKIFTSRALAHTAAKQILNSLPDGIKGLRVVRP